MGRAYVASTPAGAGEPPTTVETLTDWLGAAIATSASVTPETVTDSVPAQLSRNPALHPPETPSACTSIEWTPATTGPRSCTPVAAPGASVPEMNSSMPSTRTCTMMSEQWVVAASNATWRPPAV